METPLQSSPPDSEKLDDRRPPLATTKRIQRRGRLISSRYMTAATPVSAPSSPIHPSSTSSYSLPQNFPTLPHPYRNPLQNPKHRRIPSVPSSPDATGFEFEASSHYADENWRSFETPVYHRVQGKAPATHRRPHVSLLSDNAGDVPYTPTAEHHKGTADSKISPGRSRIGASRARDGCIETPGPVYNSRNQLNSTKKTAKHEVKSKPVTPFHSSNDTMAFASSEKSSTLVDSWTDSCHISNQGGLCRTPPIRAQGNSRTCQTLELRSSMPDAVFLPTSSRRQAEGEELMIRRSLNSALSSCQVNPLNLMKTVDSKTSVRERYNFGRTFFPPQPLNSRPGLDVKKGKKESSRKEDVHALHLLHNQYLQWRFINAKAKIACEARAVTAENSLSEVSKNLNELLRGSVTEKRMELEKLKRLERLSTILDLEMPYLEEWSLEDGEFCPSLSGTIKALQDASIRLPLVGDLKVDVTEVKEAIHSVASMFESLSPSVGRFLPTVGGVENVITDLAIIASREKSLIEECGSLLSEVQLLQVKECSLRSTLMQVKGSNII